MKVLYVDHPEADFLASVVFMGLCEELGCDNVVDYPYKPSHHGIVHHYRPPYERDPGSSLWQTWRMTENGPMGSTAPFEWMKASTGKQWSEDEVASRIGEFDLVVLASPRQYNSGALSDLIRKVGRSSIRRLVMMHGEDYTEVRWDFVDAFRPSVYFIREMLQEPAIIYPEQHARLNGTVRIRPFPFGSPVPELPVVPKDIDVAFLGGNNWHGRAETVRVLTEKLGSRFIGGNVAYADYLTTLSRAKIAISTRGFGWDPLRFYEIASCPGTMLVSDRSPVIKPFPFVEGEHCCYFSSSTELLDIIERYLWNESERARVAASGNAHLRQHHTARARAQQLLEESLR